MSDVLRVLLVGAGGLVGQQVLALSVGRENVRIKALARREVSLPEGARLEVFLAPSENWGNVVGEIRPDRVVCALGTTIAKMDGDQAAFAAVDRDLVLKIARAAKGAGASGFVAVSSVGADALSKNFYLKTKGEMEQGLTQIGFDRLDILQPGLLRGRRVDDARPMEQLGKIASPLLDLALHGERRKYRSSRAEVVAEAAMQAVLEKASGRFTHQHDGIQRLAAKLDRREI